jgi:hypothetical protein
MRAASVLASLLRSPSRSREVPTTNGRAVASLLLAAVMLEQPRRSVGLLAEAIGVGALHTGLRVLLGKSA